MDRIEAVILDVMKGTQYKAKCDDGSEKPFVIGYAILDRILYGSSDDEVESFASRLSDHWGLGHVGCYNPILVFMSRGNRVLTIRTGRQARRFVPDSVSKMIVRDAIDSLKQGNQNYALELVALRLREQLNGTAPYRWALLWQYGWPWLLGFGVVLLIGFCCCTEQLCKGIACCSAGCCYGLLLVLTAPLWVCAFCLDGCTSCFRRCCRCCRRRRPRTGGNTTGNTPEESEGREPAEMQTPGQDHAFRNNQTERGREEVLVMSRVYAALQKQAAADLGMEFAASAPPLPESQTLAAPPQSSAERLEKGEGVSTTPSAPPLPEGFCSICLDSLPFPTTPAPAAPPSLSVHPGVRVTPSVATLACGHAFHQDCIVEWGDQQARGGETSCPFCRASFDLTEASVSVQPSASGTGTEVGSSSREEPLLRGVEQQQQNQTLPPPATNAEADHRYRSRVEFYMRQLKQRFPSLNESAARHQLLRPVQRRDGPLRRRHVRDRRVHVFVYDPFDPLYLSPVRRPWGFHPGVAVPAGGPSVPVTQSCSGNSVHEGLGAVRWLASRAPTLESTFGNVRTATEGAAEWGRSVQTALESSGTSGTGAGSGGSSAGGSGGGGSSSTHWDFSSTTFSSGGFGGGSMGGGGGATGHW